MRSRDWGQSVEWIIYMDAEAAKVMTGVKTQKPQLQRCSEPSLAPQVLLMPQCFVISLKFSLYYRNPHLCRCAEFPFLVTIKLQSEFTRSSSYFPVKIIKFLFYFPWIMLTGASMRDEMRLGPGTNKKRRGDWIHSCWFIFDSRLTRLL